MSVYKDLYPMDGEHVPDYIAPNIRTFKRRKRKEFNAFLKAINDSYRKGGFMLGSAWIDQEAFLHMEKALNHINHAKKILRKWWRKA